LAPLDGFPRRSRAALGPRQSRSQEMAGRENASVELQRMSELKSQRTVIVTNPQGLHARPADMFVKLANRFESRIEIVKDSERVDGKSILAILTLAAAEGTTLSIEATGRDAEQALDALAELVAQNFAEDQTPC
jgi:phosphocarrier protein HPr